MATERLYYADSYLRAAAARVIERTSIEGRPAVALDRTVFYPTGGGQPHDTGLLSVEGGEEAAPVVDVIADDGLVWHVLGSVLHADAVVGIVDWERRFDHMQQHTGQHVLSQAFAATCGAETVGFHLGMHYSTIDLDRADLSPDGIASAEAAANAVVDRALPVTAEFVSPDVLQELPLRKPPKVTAGIRIVQVEGFDWSACGGTHVAGTAEIGLIKVVSTERRGSELRVTFLCGRRARADYARLHSLAQGLVARLTTSQDELLDAIDRRAAEMEGVRKELADMERHWVEAVAARLHAGATPRGAYRLVSTSVDYPVERAKRVAQALRAFGGTVVLLGVRGERPQIIFTRADDVPLDAGSLLRTAVAAGGGRGGGRPDWAQGGVPTNEALHKALSAAEVLV